MGWFLFGMGWLLLIGGGLMFLTLPLLYQAYVAPVMLIGAIWIGFGGVVERLDMLRRALKDRP